MKKAHLLILMTGGMMLASVSAGTAESGGAEPRVPFSRLSSERSAARESGGSKQIGDRLQQLGGGSGLMGSSEPFEMRGPIQEIGRTRITVSGTAIQTRNAAWLNEGGQPISSGEVKVGDLVEVTGQTRRGSHTADTITKVSGTDESGVKVALLFVGHGEPETAENGDVPITLADGEPFGPHAVELGVPPAAQQTEWAAAYEEIATALAYIFGDTNNNNIPHEVGIAPAGDVPPFFVWPAFHGEVYAHYAACANYSAHNDSLRAHVASLDIQVDGAQVDVYLAFLDAVPRIRDVIVDIVAADDYTELVVIPMLISLSTHTDEIDALVEESEHLISDMDVLITEPFFEIPFMRKRLKNAALAMADYVRAAVPADVEDDNIAVLLTSHGTPYVPPYPEFGWVEGEIYSHLIPTEDAFHEDIGSALPWAYRTGRMNYSSPTIEDSLAELEGEGFTHILVVPSAFPTPAIHTMWDVASAAVGRAVLPQERVVMHTRPSGMKVYYSAEGLAHNEPGQGEFRRGLDFLGRIAVLEALEDNEGEDGGETPYEPCRPGELCVAVDADLLDGTGLRFMLYDAAGENWPQAFQDVPIPDWVVTAPPDMPDRFPARIRIPLEGNLFSLFGGDVEGAELGLIIAAGEGIAVEPTDARGFSASTLVYQAGEAMNFGTVNLALPGQGGDTCEAGEICVTITDLEATGPDLKLMLYEATDATWPQSFLSLPTPSWVVTETVPVSGDLPIHIQIPIEGNLFTINSDTPIEGARVGLAVVTGVASTFIVDPADARGFSTATMEFAADGIMDFGEMAVLEPVGDVCDLNPYHPNCLTGPLFWQERYLGAEGFVPGAIYMDLADIDGDTIDDIVMVGEPHFENPELPLTVLKLGVYYLNADGTVRETEIIDEWSEADPVFYSPWGVRVIMHSGAPMIIVGTNIPELAPLEEGSGDILSYRKVAGAWVRELVRSNPTPLVENYNSMIVVPSDIDNDGDTDLALSGAFGTSSVGNWMENTGNPDTPWVPHLLPAAPGTDPAIRGTLAYKSVDLNGDNYPEVVHNAMFDIPGSDPPRYRGEIWLAVNPGPTGWDSAWQMVVIDSNNWASADMWFHDFTGDDKLDLVANQLFNGTVTLYQHPGADLADPWVPEVIISGLTSPSDMWLADMDNDTLMDVVSADHTAHRGVWHKNPGPGGAVPWQQQNVIFDGIRLPGDFAIADVDGDGDQDWVGTSLSLGQAFIVEQVQPDTSLVATISLPAGFSGDITKLLLTLVSDIPVTGPPAAILATINNVDSDGDGLLDVDQVLNASRDLVLAIEDVGVAGDYYVYAALYMDGGGVFQPVPGIDYMGVSGQVTLGGGGVSVDLDLELVPVPFAGDAGRAAEDSDGDGLTDEEERIAGTRSDDSSDSLKIVDAQIVTGNGAITLHWDSKPGRLYTVYMSTDLLADWTPVYQVPGDGTLKTYSNSTTVEPCFYQLKVEDR